MKKTYINPNIEVVKMKISQPLLDASQGSLSISEGDRIGSSSDFGAHDDDFDW